MNPETIRQRLRDLLRSVRAQAAHDALSADADFIQTLALDSLDVGNFLTEVETEFNVQLGLEGFEQLVTLERLSFFIVRMQGAAAGSERNDGLDGAPALEGPASAAGSTR